MWEEERSTGGRRSAGKRFKDTRSTRDVLTALPRPPKNLTKKLVDVAAFLLERGDELFYQNQNGEANFETHPRPHRVHHSPIAYP